MNPFQTAGAFSWCELITTDPTAAKAFYGEVFGWRFKKGQVTNAPYTVIEVEGQEIGGISPAPPDMKPIWGTYVTVKNLEATLQKVETLGGKVLIPPIVIPPSSKFALIQDPQGAAIAVISYSSSDS
ncbi:MAG: VOC family protein, partial [Snowella sp.]|nr:VOC family protein [Snowella sp.]